MNKLSRLKLIEMRNNYQRILAESEHTDLLVLNKWLLILQQDLDAQVTYRKTMDDIQESLRLI